MPNVCCLRDMHPHRGPASKEFKDLSATSPHNCNDMFTEHEFVNHQGLMLHAYSRQPTRPKRGAVVMLHGAAVHALYMSLLPEKPGQPHTIFEGSLAARFLDAGFAVYLLDMQGHGLSEAARGEMWFMESFEDYVSDFLQFTELVKKAEVETQNIFAFGISMGGGVVTKAAINKPDFVKGLMLFCPMLSLEKVASKPANRIMRPFAGLVSAACPTAKVAKMQKNEKFPHTEQEKLNDKLTNHNTAQCARTAFECLNFSHFMTRQGGCKKVRTPFIVFHSPDDTLVDPASSDILFTEAASIDKKFVPATDMWHVLTQEPGKERLFEEVALWLMERS